MTDEVATPDGAAVGDPPHRSLNDDVRSLAAAGRDLAQAELAYQKARAAYAGKATRNIVLASGAALTLGFLALIALVLGLILTLAPVLTPIGATAAVVAGLLIVAILCLMIARSSVKSMKAVLSEPGGDDV